MLFHIFYIYLKKNLRIIGRKIKFQRIEESKEETSLLKVKILFQQLQKKVKIFKNNWHKILFNHKIKKYKESLKMIE